MGAYSHWNEEAAIVAAAERGSYDELDPGDGYFEQGLEPDEGEGPWAIVDGAGKILYRCDDQTEADEELMTGEWPEDAEVAYVN